MKPNKYSEYGRSDANALLAQIRRQCQCGRANCKCQAGNGLLHCPCHNDVNPSFSVTLGGDGKILLKCHAGCSQDTVVAHFKTKGLWPSRFEPKDSGRHRHSSQRAAPPTAHPRGGEKQREKPRDQKEAAYSYTDEAGRLLYQIVRFETGNGKQILSRRPHPQAGWVWGLKEGWYRQRSQGGRSQGHHDWERVKGKGADDSRTPPNPEVVWFPAVKSVLYNLPKIQDTEIVLVVEGEKCADALNAALQAEGINAVATTNSGGAGKWHDSYCEPLVHKQTVVLPDNDEAGIKHAQQVCQSIASVVASVKLVELPGLPPKGDVVQWLAAGHTVQEIMDLAAATAEWAPKGQESQPPLEQTEDSSLPIIITNNRQLRWLTADAKSAIIAANVPPTYFVRGQQLVRLSDVRNGPPSVMPVSVAALRGTLSHVATWHQARNNKPPLNVSPPREVAEVLIASNDWPAIPELLGVVSAPVCGPDGSICTNTGYHPATRLYYFGPALELGDITPTPANVAAALDLLLDECLGDFPFADAASRAHALALILLPFVRPLIEGPTPLHLIDAPAAGTGKTLLAEVTMLIFTGKPVAAMTWGVSGEEGRKRLTAKLLKGQPYVFLDNIVQLDSPDLAAALTADQWEDRVLGRSQNVTLPITNTWLATSNNAALSGEIARRTVWIRLDANVERPYLRGGFRHPHLRRWMRAQRAALVTAVLTLVQAWLEAGRPAYSGANPSPGSFEAWADVIGGILESVGVAGFLGNATKLYDQAEPQSGAWFGFMAAWHEQFGERSVGVKNLLTLARQWIDAELGEKGDRSQAIHLGQVLHKSVGRIFGQFQLQYSGQHQRAGQYRVIRLAGEPSSPVALSNGAANTTNSDTANDAAKGDAAKGGDANSGGANSSDANSDTANDAGNSGAAKGGESGECGESPRGSFGNSFASNSNVVSAANCAAGQGTPTEDGATSKAHVVSPDHPPQAYAPQDHAPRQHRQNDPSGTNDCSDIHGNHHIHDPRRDRRRDNDADGGFSQAAFSDTEFSEADIADIESGWHQQHEEF